MVRGTGGVQPSQSPAQLGERVETLGPGPTGTVCHVDGSSLPW